MPIALRWYDQDAILLMDCQGPVSWEDMVAPLEKLSTYLNAAKRPLHLIMDWRKASGSPFQYSELPRAIEVLRHRNMGWVAVAGMSPVLAFWSEVLTKLGGLRYAIFSSPEESAQFLREMDKVRQGVAKE